LLAAILEPYFETPSLLWDMLPITDLEDWLAVAGLWETL